MVRSALAVACLALSLSLAGCGGGNDTPSSPSDGGTLQIEELTVGTGATAATGDTVTVNYVGTFTNGNRFDAGQGLTFRIGAGQVIAGFEQGVQGMKVGGKRRLTIPPSLAYGSAGYPPVIPGNATLIFEIDLVSIAGK